MLPAAVTIVPRLVQHAEEEIEQARLQIPVMRRTCDVMRAELDTSQYKAADRRSPAGYNDGLGGYTPEYCKEGPTRCRRFEDGHNDGGGFATRKKKYYRHVFCDRRALEARLSTLVSMLMWFLNVNTSISLQWSVANWSAHSSSWNAL